MSNSCCPNLGEPVKQFVKPKRAVNVVFLHCTASSNPIVDAETVNNWHLSNGWSCIGYHYLITTQGELQYGRSSEQTPAAQSGYNTGSIAICLNGLYPSDFNETQFNTLRGFCGEINSAYGGKMMFRGHKEVAAKDCPVFDYRKVLGLDANGYMTGETDPVEPPTSLIPMVKVTANLAQVGKGDEHPHVRLVQALLEIGVDGDFGPKTDEAVRAFQRVEGLTADGIVGVKTYERLLDVGDD